MTFKSAISLCVLSCVTVLTSHTLPAAAKDPIGTMAEVSLLPGWTMRNGHYMAALQVKLAPGWHTYWRAPGAAGIPPQLDWSGSKNIANVQFHWPIPNIYVQNDMPFLGYETELILPIEFTPVTAGTIVVQGDIMMGVCEDVCMPYTATFQGTLAQNTPAPHVGHIKAALERQPKRLSGARCAATVIEDGMTITATLKAPSLGPTEMAVLEHPDPNVWVSESITTRSGRTVTVQSDMVPEHAKPFFVDRSQLRITLIGANGTAFEALGCSGS